MANITFKGIIIAWNPEPRHAYQLIICCMARTGPKMFHPLSLEGDFTKGMPDFTPEIGNYAFGVAKLLNIVDGSILVEFMKDKFHTIASDTCLDFNNDPLKYVYAPRAGRQMRLLAKEFYRRRLFPEYYPNQLNWNARKQPFGSVAPCLLAKAGYSMAKIEGHAIFITKIKNNKAIESLRNCAFETDEVSHDKKLLGHKKGKKTIEKFAIFLLAGMTAEIHNPAFMISRMEKANHLKQGQIYHFKDLPILAVEDDIREEESTIFCGKGSFQPDQHIWQDTLLQLYYDLGNCEMMPGWLWNKYFRKKLERTVVQRLKIEMEEMITAKGIDIPKQIHGWWYYWEPIFKLNVPLEEEIVVLAPAFRDGGPARIIIVPMSVYENKKLRKIFSLHSSAVSVCETPEIIEGDFRPEPESWEQLKFWITENRRPLEEDWLDIDRLCFFKYG